MQFNEFGLTVRQLVPVKWQAHGPPETSLGSSMIPRAITRAGGGDVGYHTLCFDRCPPPSLSKSTGLARASRSRGEEDICFARAAADLAAKVPSREVAQEFSVETIYHPAPIGCHKPWQYLLPSDMQRLLQIWEPAD
eukprot:s1329_g5.t1